MLLRSLRSTKRPAEAASKLTGIVGMRVKRYYGLRRYRIRGRRKSPGIPQKLHDYRIPQCINRLLPRIFLWPRTCSRILRIPKNDSAAYDTMPDDWNVDHAVLLLLRRSGDRSLGNGVCQLDCRVSEKAQTGVRPQVSYQVIREYRLFGANDSSANSDVVAEVDFRPPASKDYRIEKSSGSARGRQVVGRVLDHGVKATP